MDVDLGVVNDTGGAVLVADMVAIDRIAVAAKALAGEVTADVLD